jgi:hypothetical protein
MDNLSWGISTSSIGKQREAEDAAINEGYPASLSPLI